MKLSRSFFLPFFGLFGITTAQFPPHPGTTGEKFFNSTRFPGLSVSFKEPGICEETPGVKSYAGYVHIPPNTLSVKQEYPINTFFWFFEADVEEPKDAPFTVWTNGGPGSSSMIGLFEEIGPCEVLNDSSTTIPREWKWNRLSNMLFIDQPVQVGFSYDTLHNATVSFDAARAEFRTTLVNFTDGDIPENNSTFFKATLPSLVEKNTANNTDIAAEAFWYFLQSWTEAIPEYTENDKGVVIWAESYGGHYGPRFSAFLNQQNDKIAANISVSAPGTTPQVIPQRALGLVSSCIDYPIQYAGAFVEGVNNTYGIKFFNETVAESLLDQYLRPGGCKDAYLACQKFFLTDPYGDQGLVNQCIEAANNGICDIVDDENPRTEFEFVFQLGLNRFDITHKDTDPFPFEFWLGYLMQNSVQTAIGSPVNFTVTSNAVSTGFNTVQDRFQPGYAENLGFLLDRGIRVTMMHGDRDFACNWFGGEMTSLAVNFTEKAGFHAAGYAFIQTNDTFVGGEVRQHGNFAFSRVYEAGHESPAYSPETSFRIFERTVTGVDIPTGLVPASSNFSTVGPAKSTTKTPNEGPGDPPICYLPLFNGCTDAQVSALGNGTAVVKDYLIIDPPGPTVPDLPAFDNSSDSRRTRPMTEAAAARSRAQKYLGYESS